MNSITHPYLLIQQDETDQVFQNITAQIERFQLGEEGQGGRQVLQEILSQLQRLKV